MKANDWCQRARVRRGFVLTTLILLTFGAIGGRAGTETYGYDALGRLRSITSPNGSTTTYGIDAAGNRTSVTPGGVSSNIPQNIRKSPTTGTGGSFTILWDAVSGTVNHYTLEEEEDSTVPPSIVTYTVTDTSKAFSKSGCLQLLYRVRACATANESQCSAYSAQVFKAVGTC
jgi:YD repeat-containing protein